VETRRINAPVVIFILSPQRLREFSLFENHSKATGQVNRMKIRKLQKRAKIEPGMKINKQTSQKFMKNRVLRELINCIAIKNNRIKASFESEICIGNEILSEGVFPFSLY